MCVCVCVCMCVCVCVCVCGPFSTLCFSLSSSVCLHPVTDTLCLCLSHVFNYLSVCFCSSPCLCHSAILLLYIGMPICHVVCATECCDNEQSVIIILMISLKGAMQDFYNLFTALQTVSNRYAQMAWAQSCANYRQYIKHLPPATCHVPRGLKGQLSY